MPNCLVLYCHGAKLTWCQIVQYQIVLLPKCMVPNFPGTVCDLQGKFSVHIFFTQLIFCIFFLLMQISNILAVQTFLLFAVCICKKFHTILKSHNVCGISYIYFLTICMIQKFGCMIHCLSHPFWNLCYPKYNFHFSILFDSHFFNQPSHPIPL